LSVINNHHIISFTALMIKDTSNSRGFVENIWQPQREVRNDHDYDRRLGHFKKEEKRTRE
jgi:hypothetical protein